MSNKAQDSEEQILADLIKETATLQTNSSNDLYKTLLLAHVTRYGIPSSPKEIEELLNNLNLLHTKAFAYCQERAIDSANTMAKKMVDLADAIESKYEATESKEKTKKEFFN